MNIICDKIVLNEAIASVSKAVSSHSNLPVLEGIYIKADDEGRLTLIANDMEMGIEAKINADVKESGQTVINARMFSNIIKNVPDEKILISCSRRRVYADDASRIVRKRERQSVFAEDRRRLVGCRGQRGVSHQSPRGETDR